jgi:hypothetical protein
MATDNKGVMVYLPRDVEEVLEKYCTENNITRKNKDGEPVPSMGTGIVQYLKSHLLGIAPSSMVGTVLTKDDVLELIRESITGDGLTPEEARAIAESAIEKAIAPIHEDIQDLASQIREMRRLNAESTRTGINSINSMNPKGKAATTTDGRIEFIVFAETHCLDIKRGDSVGDVRSAMVKAGIDDRYRYDSRVRAFYEL